MLYNGITMEMYRMKEKERRKYTHTKTEKRTNERKEENSNIYHQLFMMPCINYKSHDVKYVKCE